MSVSFTCVADTHTAVWVTSDPTLLSSSAAAALRAAEIHHQPIYVSAITIVEIRYLVEKGRLGETSYQKCLRALTDPAFALTLAPLDLRVAEQLQQIPRVTVPDMPDRIIAATALALGLPLVSRDTQMRALTNISIIW